MWWSGKKAVNNNGDSSAVPNGKKKQEIILGVTSRGINFKKISTNKWMKATHGDTDES